MNHIFTEQECNLYTPEQLAMEFIRRAYPEQVLQYPINPFQILTDLGIPYNFRSFSKVEGVYIPAESDEDIPVIGINLNRPLQRQRFSAAHELCHHLKDWNKVSSCEINSKDTAERYAERFAASLLMPKKEVINQINTYLKDEKLTLDDILRIAEHFGVSFSSCKFRIRSIQASVLSGISQSQFNKYQPARKRKEFDFSDVPLYRQIIDANEENFKLKYDEYAINKFIAECVYHDSRMENINVNQEQVGEIVTDLRLYKQNSIYCREEKQELIQIAGLSLVYTKLPELAADENISVFFTKTIHRILFSCAPNPEFGGTIKTSNNLVLGSKFETVDAADVPMELIKLDDDVIDLLERENDLSTSQYIEHVVRIHHRLTVIHPFPDGNGRTSRAFTNLLLIHRGLPPVFFRYDKKDIFGNLEKDLYKEALSIADQQNDFGPLFEMYYRGILESLDLLTQNHF